MTKWKKSAGQDSIAEGTAPAINADLILEYTVTDYFATTYTTQRLDIDIAAIAECFGLTEEEVLAGINQDTGAPTINGFAIQASTHQGLYTEPKHHQPVCGDTGLTTMAMPGHGMI